MFKILNLGMALFAHFKLKVVDWKMILALLALTPLDCTPKKLSAGAICRAACGIIKSELILFQQQHHVNAIVESIRILLPVCLQNLRRSS